MAYTSPAYRNRTPVSSLVIIILSLFAISAGILFLVDALLFMRNGEKVSGHVAAAHVVRPVVPSRRNTGIKWTMDVQTADGKTLSTTYPEKSSTPDAPPYAVGDEVQLVIGTYPGWLKTTTVRVLNPVSILFGPVLYILVGVFLLVGRFMPQWIKKRGLTSAKYPQ